MKTTRIVFIISLLMALALVSFGSITITKSINGTSTTDVTYTKQGEPHQGKGAQSIQKQRLFSGTGTSADVSTSAWDINEREAAFKVYRTPIGAASAETDVLKYWWASSAHSLNFIYKDTSAADVYYIQLLGSTTADPNASGFMVVSGSNAQAASVRSNVDVYSKAETRVYADGIATSSSLALSNHAIDNSSIHGCGAIASLGANIFAGDQTFATDNTYDIGTATDNRPKNVHAAGSFYEAGTVLSGKYAALAGSTTQDFSIEDAKIYGWAGAVGSTDSNGQDITLKAGFGTGGGNGGGDLYLAAGRGNSDASTGNIYFGYSAPTDLPGTDFTYGSFNASGELLIATSTDAGDYKLQIDGCVFVASDVSALSFTDRSDAPDNLAEAYDIIESHECSNGHVNHSKLHQKAYGRKSIPNGIVSDPSKRNLSMIISAQAEVIKDMIKRIEALETK